MIILPRASIAAYDDIEAVIGTDKEAARRAVKELFPWMYIEEYRKEVDLL